MADALETLRQSAVEIGEIYVDAVKSGDYTRATGCAHQLIIRIAEAIPQEDEFNSANTLLANIALALQEVLAGKFDHPILKGRHKVGGVGQLSASQEMANGIGAAVMLFLRERDVSEDAAAKLVSSAMGVSATAPKNWIAARKRKLLKAMVAPSLESIKRDFDQSHSQDDPVRFARQWLRERLKAMFTLSPP